MKTYGNDPLECPKCKTKMQWDGIYDWKRQNLELKIIEIEKLKTYKGIKELEKIYETIKRLGKGNLEPLFA